MIALRWLPASTVLFGVILAAGCAVVPRADWNALESNNAALAAENRNQASQLENLRAHARGIESKLSQAEEELAALDEQHETTRRKLAGYQFDRDQWNAEFQGIVGHRWGASPETSGRLAEIARRYPQLQFDQQTGIAKLDTDILFDIGESELKPAAEATLRELVAVLKQPEAGDLRVLVVGHTDDKPVARRPARDEYRDNIDLSADRAVAVSETLARLGLAPSRIGVAGFGAHQPIAPNITSTDRQKNRRVELFVLGPDVPVVGWTDTIPSVY